MTSLRFRLPGRVQSLGAWLTSLLPSIDRPGRRRLIEEGRIRLDGRVADRSTLDCPPGAIVEIEDLPDLVCEPSATGLHRSWQAIVDLPPWRFGALDIDPRSVLEFERVEVRGALARLVLSGEPCDAAAVCEGLARGSMPVVGDLARGGLGIAGGPRLAPLEGSTSDASLVWPEEETWRLDAHEEGAGEFVVSRETGRALRAGHPWILPDAASDPATRFRPGALVRVVDRESGPLGWAHVEAAPHLAARLWSLGASARRQIPSVEARVARAVARRRALWVDLAVGGTNAFRLVHGEGDGLPGLFVDRLGPLLRVLVTGWSCEGFRQRAVAALRSQLPVSPEGDPWSVLELLHLRRAGASRVGRVQWAEGGIESLEEAGFETIREGFFVEERGLRFFVDPGWDAPYQPRPGYGLFVDQRENRERLARFAAGGGRWLNLFAHTGAFSVALLAAGAERVVSVDLSGAYLARLEDNLSANRDRGVEPSRHESIRIDGRRYLEGLDPQQRFRGIVIDPPTAAAAGHRFWSVQRDLEPLLQRAVEHLEEGGVMLVTQNRAGAPLGIDRVLERVFRRAHREISTLEPAPAGFDHPNLKGFSEGDPFEGWIVTLV